VTGVQTCALPILLANTLVNDLCVSWRNSLRRVWRLPFTTHCYLLPFLRQYLSLEEENSRGSLSFITECVHNSS